MLVNLEEYRIKKQMKNPTGKVVKIPVYSRIYVENNKLIGELDGSNRTEIIKDYHTE